MTQRGIVGIKDIDLKILMDMNDKELLSLCNEKNKYFFQICKDENFWQKRFLQRFGEQAAKHKPIGRTWKNNYMRIIIDLQRFANDPWSFLPYVLWHRKGFENSLYRDDDGFTHPFSKAPEWVMNNFYLLNLGPATVNGVFYPSITPFQIFESQASIIPSSTLVAGAGILRNKDVFVGTTL